MIGSHNSDVKLAFYNDRVKEIIAPALLAEPFTYVPITAGHMELVGGNAVVFGKITEGYDVISIDIRPEISYEDVSLSNPIVDLAVTYDLLITKIVYYNGNGLAVDKVIWDGTLEMRELYGIIVITLPLIIKEGSTYSISVFNVAEGINVTASYTALPGDTYVQVKAGLIAALLAAGTPNAEIQYGLWGANKIFFYGRMRSFRDVPLPAEAGDVNTIYKDFIVNAYILTLGLTIKYSQLKCGAVHSYGAVYKDRSGRVCSVIKIPDIYIPFYSEDVEGGGNDLGSIINLVFKIYNKPPDWAESYEIVYFGNVSMDYFLQLRASNITLIPNSNGHRFSVNIQDTLAWTRTQNNRWKVSDYSWEAGDRMRLLGTIDEATGYGEAIGGDFVYDYEIESTGTQYNEEAIGGDWLIVQAVEHPTPFEGEVNILTEIYRPRKGMGQTVAYGTGMVFDIGIDAEGRKYHKGNVDQNLNTDAPAQVNNTANDCWKFFRLNYKQIGVSQTGIIQPFWAESIFPSDWWSAQTMSSRLTSQGFPFLDDLSQRQTILPDRFRFGGALIEGTRTNNIAHFTFENFRDLQRKSGEITGLREIGFTLKVIQMYKETYVYINRVQTFNPDGSSQYVLTDTFIGDMRPMEDDFGSQHPDSIMVNGRNLYYWDNSQGVFIRSSPNGQQVLDIKMKRWFKDLVRWIQTSGGKEILQVRTGANNDHEEIWLSFRMGAETRGIIFSEKQGRFISRMNQTTESYIHLGNFFAHLYQQRLWIMNIDEGQDYLSWSGMPTYAEVEVVSNIDSLKNKIFNAIGIVADHLLKSLSRYVYIPAEASGVNELMESNIPVFERKEGIYFGKIMKDENSRGNFSSVYDRKLNGREMRGRYCFVKVMTDEHEEKVRIDSIVIFSTPSERNL